MTQSATAGEICRHVRRLPFGSLDELLQGQPPLILAPHPDDESLGCGGLIAAACAAEMPPLVVIVTDGTGSHPSSKQFPAPARRALREREAAKAVSWLELPDDRLLFLGLPDSGAPTEGSLFEDTVDIILQLARTYDCGSIFASWWHDPHCDHEATYLLGAAAAIQSGRRLLSYPVWGWTLPEDMPLEGRLPRGIRLDISAQMPAKRRAIAAHKSQHGKVITDAPDGFVLPPELLRNLDTHYEVYLGDIR
jgi:LmbE family N-acetylglucosaminyl deacetylase